MRIQIETDSGRFASRVLTAEFPNLNDEGELNKCEEVLNKIEEIIFHEEDWYNCKECGTLTEVPAKDLPEDAEEIVCSKCK